jgi:hypothetical protein
MGGCSNPEVVAPAGVVNIIESTPFDVTHDGDRERSRLWALVCASRSRDLAAVLSALCAVAVAELGLSGAAVSLMTLLEPEAGQAGTVAAASSQAARAVEELEFSLGEGPGTDAFLRCRPVLTSDLQRGFGRWPGYVPAAVAAGVCATFAFPMHVGAARFGVLHLHSSHRRFLTDPEMATSLTLTELATEIVLDAWPGAAEHGAPDRRLLGTTDRRDVVYQAQGKVMVELGVSLPEALARLRAHAFAAEVELADLACDILAGRTRLPPDADDAP